MCTKDQAIDMKLKTEEHYQKMRASMPEQLQEMIKNGEKPDPFPIPDGKKQNPFSIPNPVGYLADDDGHPLK